jgi:hypothetical protein
MISGVPRRFSNMIMVKKQHALIKKLYLHIFSAFLPSVTAVTFRRIDLNVSSIVETAVAFASNSFYFGVLLPSFIGR